jgi:hypothetical protein
LQQLPQALPTGTVACCYKDESKASGILHVLWHRIRRIHICTQHVHLHRRTAPAFWQEAVLLPESNWLDAAGFVATTTAKK